MIPTVPVIANPAHGKDVSGVLSHGWILPPHITLELESGKANGGFKGRGGAGNMGPGENEHVETVEDIKIPLLKSLVYTTGRGGTGNMALNDPENPEKARRAQDVEEPPRILSSSEFHGGRGGAGNVVNQDDIDIALAYEEEEKQKLAEKRPEPVDHSKIDYRGWADRGKDKLFGRKKKKT